MWLFCFINGWFAQLPVHMLLQMQLIHEISNLKNLVKHAEVYNQDLEVSIHVLFLLITRIIKTNNHVIEHDFKTYRYYISYMYQYFWQFIVNLNSLNVLQILKNSNQIQSCLLLLIFLLEWTELKSKAAERKGRPD